jgi:nitrite reductase (NADH) small subunit
MTDTGWIPITVTSNIPPREGRAVSVGTHDIAVFNLGDRFVAVDNRCPHQGGPLSDGIVSGNTVVCPLHAWKIDLDSGRVARPQSASCVRTYPLRLENDVIAIQLPDARGGEGDGKGRAA